MWRLVVISIDVATAVCAAFSFLYFARRFMASGDIAPTRRAAVAVLSVISLATLVESVALLVLVGGASTPDLGTGSWALVRAFTLAGAVSMAALVAERMARR